MSGDRFDGLITSLSGASPARTVVVHPCDPLSLSGALDARDQGLIAPVLVGPPTRIEQAAEEAGRGLEGVAIEPAPHSHAAAARAVAMVRAGEADLIMKGSLHTDELMHEVVAPETGLRTARRVSHVYVMDAPAYPKLLMITDAAINIAPDLEDKRDIVQNAVDLAHAIGIDRPLVAVLSAVETVTSKLRSTIDAAALCKMADRGQITGCLIDGPLAFDNAISALAAREKGIVSDVAGHPDILLTPDLEAGNMLAKQLTFLAGAHAAAVVMGARAPVVLTSRADGARTRVASCALAVLAARASRAVKA